MDYGHLINRALSLAGRYKALWIFGMFALTGLSNNVDFSTPIVFGEGNFMDPETIEQFDPEMLTAMFEGFWPALVALLLLNLIMQLISRPALIDAANRILRGGTYSFATTWSSGLNFFFRYLGLALLILLIMIGTLIVTIALFTLIAAGLGAGFGGGGDSAPGFMQGLGVVIVIFFILIVFPLFLLLSWAAYTIHALAARSLVVRDSGVFDALTEGWQLFWGNLGKSFLVGLIWFLLMIGMSILLGIIGLLLYTPINMALANMFGMGAMYVIVMLLIGIPVTFLVGGFFGCFSEHYYTIFYLELVEPGSTVERLESEMTPPAPPTA